MDGNAPQAAAINRKNLKQKLTVGAGALAIVVIILAGLHFYLDRLYRGIVADFATSLQPSLNLTYATIDVSPFLGHVTLGDVNLRARDAVIAKSVRIDIGKLRSSGGQLTRANIDAKSVQISPTGADISPANGKNFALVGDTTFEYSHNPGNNSYAANNFSFLSQDGKLNVKMTEAKIDNLSFAQDGKTQSFAFAVSDAAITRQDARSGASSGVNQDQTTKFSAQFGYERLNDSGMKISNFALILPEINDKVVFSTASVESSDTNGIPMMVAAEIKSLDMPLNLQPEIAAMWKDYAYTRLKADAKFKYAFDAETKKINAAIAMDLDSMFKTSITATLAGVDLAEIAKTQGTPVPYEQLTIENAEVNFTDASFLKKTYEIESKRQNITVEQYLAQRNAEIDSAFIPDPAKPDPALVDVAGKLKAYLQNPGTITFNLHPTEPVALSQIMIGLILDRVKLMKVMGMTVTIS